MQIVDNRALVLRTRDPSKYSIIPKSRVLDEVAPGIHEVAVHWGLDEVRVLRNLGVKKVPSPITARYDWPGRWRPMAHQIETAAFLTLHQRAFVLNEPGTGKTMSALWAADYLMRIGKVRRVLVLCPMSIMHSAWMNDITSSVVHRSAVVAHHSKASRRGELVRGDYEFVIMNYDGLPLVAQDVRRDGRFDLIIVDECFVAGTEVTTPNGVRRIETLVAGERVLTSNGPARIKRLVRNTATHLVDVRLSNGKTIRCTPEHPFFTDAGWVCARDLAGRRLVSDTILSRLRGVVPGPEGTLGEGAVGWDEVGADLLSILRTEEVARGTPGSGVLQQHAGGKAGQGYGDAALRRVQGGDVGEDQGDGPQAGCAGRERHRHDAGRDAGATCVGKRLGVELPRSVGREAARLSYELQARLCQPDAAGGAGGGRQHTQQQARQGTRCEEDSKTADAWVESVSHIECDGAVRVYNLEVEGAPNYFVEGQLVHNCSAYKTTSTRRWKTLQSVLTQDTRLWMMTGTPAAQSPLDAYGLAKLVTPANVPGFFGAWRDKVMNKITMFKWAPKADARDKVFAALQPAIRFAKEDCLDLPPVMKETRIVELTPQQAKYYRLIKDQMLASASGETITAVNKAAVVNKLLQISAGAAYTDMGEVVEFDCKPRLNVLLEVLQETERKVIVFALFRSVIVSIANHLADAGINADVIHGDVSATKRGELINRFQHTPDLRVLVMQPQAAAHGITLTAADTVVFYGPLMSVEQYTQAIARADRKGQTSDKVRVVHIQGSPIEEKMFKAMDGKVEEHRLLADMFDAEFN